MRGFRPQNDANGGAVPFGARGLNELRSLIPQMESMGYKQAQPQVQQPQDNRGVAGLKAIIPQMEAMGYKQQPQQYFADGGFVQGIKRAFGMDEERNAQIAAYRARAAAEKAQQQAQAQQSAQTAAPAVSDYAGMNAMKRREKELGLADGGMVRGPSTGTPTKTQPPGYWSGVGEYWSKSNADFEAQNPNLLQRGVRAINPITGFGSAVGAMHDGASSGSMRDMAIAAMQAVPVFGAMRAVAPTMKSIAGAAPVLVPSAAKTAAGVAAGTTAGVAADVAQEQQQTPQPQQRAVTEYSGMSATQRREKELGLADGGRVRPRGFVAGKGTATSDSIPARLSNGEYVLPADTVRAVGVEALDALRESTHKPVKGEQAHAARGFFAGGTPGGVGAWFQDQQREQEQRKQEALAAGQAADGAAQAAAAPAQGNTSATQAGSYAPGTRGAQLVAAEQQKEQDRAAMGNALVDAIKAPFSKPATPATPSLTAPATQPAAAATNPTDARLAAGTQTSPMSGAMNQPKPQPKPQPDAQGDTATTTAREVVPGVYSHGRGQYSDDPNGMNMPKGFTGRPSAQNDAILQRMSDKSQAESMARVGMSQYDAEVQRAKNINADEAARNNSVGARMQRLADPFTAEGRAMRNLQMNIDSSLDRNGRPTADTAALVAQSKAMSDGYLAEPNQQRTIEAGLEREGMQQAGATTRTGMQEQGANAREAGRNALTAEELGLKREAQGFQTRAAKRLEDLQNRYQSAKTPEERTAIAQQLRELQGKDEPPTFKSHVLPNVKNADGSTTMGGVYQENLRTGGGQWVQPQDQKPAASIPADASKRVVGQTYIAPNGQTVRWSGAGWAPV